MWIVHPLVMRYWFNVWWFSRRVPLYMRLCLSILVPSNFSILALISAMVVVGLTPNGKDSPIIVMTTIFMEKLSSSFKGGCWKGCSTPRLCVLQSKLTKWITESTRIAKRFYSSISFANMEFMFLSHLSKYFHFSFLICFFFSILAKLNALQLFYGTHWIHVAALT